MSSRGTTTRPSRRSLRTLALVALGLGVVALLAAPRAAAGDSVHQCGHPGFIPDNSKAGMSMWASSDESKA
jgi:hypothetical protein